MRDVARQRRDRHLRVAALDGEGGEDQLVGRQRASRAPSGAASRPPRRRRMRTCGKRAPVAVSVPSITRGSLLRSPGRPPLPDCPRMSSPPVLVVFGARNVGRAVVADRLAAGWRALAVARSDATLDALREAHPAVEVAARRRRRPRRGGRGARPRRARPRRARPGGQRHHLGAARPQLRRRPGHRRPARAPGVVDGRLPAGRLGDPARRAARRWSARGAGNADPDLGRLGASRDARPRALGGGPVRRRAR